jgi:mannose-1-phosphate guanylyltransferase
MTNVILCGGSGTRLWPISRTLMPKQFIQLFDNESLFQLTVKRNSHFCSKQLIVSNFEQYFLASDQLNELDNSSSQYLLEPIARNTAPAIALSCFSLAENELVLVTPSDHLIKDQLEYEKVLKKATELANKDVLVTFGIKTLSAETGYGYIQSKQNSHDVIAFHEKPNQETANGYFKNTNYYWNSGMFCFKAKIFLSELKRYSPDIYNMAKKAYESSKKDDIIRIKHEDMLAIPNNSIDYAVMEKSSKIKVIPSDIQWSDVGSFNVLDKELEKDNNNNVKANSVSINSNNNFLYSDSKLIATIDIDDMMIVDTKDALLVGKKSSSQKVKQIVDMISEATQLHNTHLKGYRPWGVYNVLEDKPGYKIKQIEVKPHKRLSLQKHKFRNEHWIVVKGTATVTLNNKEFILNENESTYIKSEDLHRLSNNTDELLTIIEVQVGSYTGEDDIERFEDDFSRV